MSVINQNLLLTPEGYQISRSVRLRSSASAYFNRTPASAGSQTTWSMSLWVKRGSLGSTQRFLTVGSAATDAFGFTSSDTFQFFTDSTGQNLITSQVFRDTSAWYHFLVVNDTAQATAANRVKIYLNGSQITAFGTATYPAQNSTGTINSASAHNIARRLQTASEYLDGYLTEVNFIDGQALTPSSFGETDAVTGVWKPKKYAGTYGTNGFYLNFSDNSAATAATIGKDSSGNGNNWTPNNISVTSGVTYDSMLDVPTMYADGGNGRGNYCVMNPIAFNGSYCVDGNLAYAGANGTSGRASFAMPTTGKWYWEVNQVDAAVNYVGFGLADAALTNGSNNAGNSATGMWGVYPTSTMYYSLNGATGVNTGVSPPALGGCMACAYDADTGYLWFGYAASGAGSITWFASGNPSTGSNPLSTISAGRTLFPFMSSNNTTANKSAINFGQRPFSQTPPTGFKALNTQNLPDATIKNGAQYMAATLYTGNSSTQTISNAVNGVSFQPDFVWIKDRSVTSQHVLTDSVRGVDRQLFSSLTNAEQTSATAITSLNSNGFTTGANPSPTGATNSSSDAYVGWQWKAGGTAVSNTSGSITSSVSANTTAGFSVVTYTGTGASATIGHGLGVAPSMIIAKWRTGGSTQGWPVYHASTGASKYLVLNTTAAASTNAPTWVTAPTSSVFSVSTDNWNNGSGFTFVAYCFSEVAGFSKFGSYTGNGSTDGPFVYLGFKPRFVMIKRTDSTSNWYMFDTARDTYNVMKTELLANSTNADADNTRWIDCLSNGFKIRNDNVSQINANGGTFVYACFAENPFRYSLAR